MLHIPNDANHLDRLADRVEMESPANRIQTSKNTRGERFVHDRHTHAVRRVMGCERSPPAQRDSHREEIVRTHRGKQRERCVAAHWLWLPRAPEIDGVVVTRVRKRPERRACGLHTGTRGEPLGNLTYGAADLIGITRTFAREPGHERDDTTRIESWVDLPHAHQAARQETCAHEEHQRQRYLSDEERVLCPVSL